MTERLAIHGGTPVRTKIFPHIGIAEGRSLGIEEKEILSRVIDSGNLNRLGGIQVVKQFEREFADLHSARYAHAVTSGTAALHTAVAALDLEPADEIITTPITDMGTVIAILMQQCIPVFADVDTETCNITAGTIARNITERTRAIIVVHLFGAPADMDSIVALAAKHNLKVIEDAAQAYLAEFHGRYTGTIGDIGCFSLQQSKQITTGDGGILITDSEDLYRRAALFSDKAWPRTKLGEERGHLFLGVNYRMNELSGAVALTQLSKLKDIVARRRESAEWLTDELRQMPQIRLLTILPDCRSSWWMFCFYLNHEKLDVSAHDFSAALSAEGIPARCGYIPMPIFDYDAIRERKTFGTSGLPWSLPQARKNITYDRHNFPGAVHALSEIICIGWSEGITHSDAEDVLTAIQKVAAYYVR